MAVEILGLIIGSDNLNLVRTVCSKMGVTVAEKRYRPVGTWKMHLPPYTVSVALTATGRFPFYMSLLIVALSLHVTEVSG